MCDRRPQPSRLMLGNEIIARAAIEGGVRFASGYPGNPSSEILEYAGRLARNGLPKVEWSINEMVALESAAGASFAGARAIVTMKHNGLAVCLDFLESLAYTGCRAGLLVVSCDDPTALSSGTRGDARPFARLAKLPCLEPGSHLELRTAVHEGLALSEEIGLPVMLRSVASLSHSMAPAEELPLPEPPAQRLHYDVSRPMLDYPPVALELRATLAERLERAGGRFESSRLNRRLGASEAPVAVIASGVAGGYAQEAILALAEAGHAVTLLTLGTVWPLPRRLIGEIAGRSQQVLVVEEAEPFLEPAIKEIVADLPHDRRPAGVYGRQSSHLPSVADRRCGALDSQQVETALRSFFRGTPASGDGPAPPAARPQPSTVPPPALPPRPPTFCAGCPHRASIWAVNTAIRAAGKEAFVVGDIGCYGMGAGPAGHRVVKVLHNMGASLGVGLGFASMRALGFDQPVLAVIGDSTLLHAGLPALAQAAANRSPLAVAVLDNGVTAMTGLQPNPATDQAVAIEDVCRGMGLETVVLDPLDVKTTIVVLAGLLAAAEPAVAILRSPCILIPGVTEGAGRFTVDPDACIGSDCGCDRFCARVLGCPANLFDIAGDTAYIDAKACTGCGLCATLCPAQAIQRLET